MAKLPDINLAVRRIIERAKREVRENPDLAKAPLQKIVLALCEELDINPAIAVFIAREISAKGKRGGQEQT